MLVFVLGQPLQDHFSKLLKRNKSCLLILGLLEPVLLLFEGILIQSHAVLLEIFELVDSLLNRIPVILVFLHTRQLNSNIKLFGIFRFIYCETDR